MNGISAPRRYLAVPPPAVIGLRHHRAQTFASVMRFPAEFFPLEGMTKCHQQAQYPQPEA